MTNRIRGALPVALAVAAVSAPTAAATPVTVNLRVEGISSTIFEGPVTTDEHLVSTAADANTPRLCNGTAAGNPAGPTATTALDDAGELAGFSWDGTWDATFNDYFPYARIGPDTVDPSTHYWALWRNWQFASFGGCGQRVSQGDDIVWAYEDFTPSALLRLTGPGSARTGESFAVKVVDGQNNSVQAGASVGGAITAANGTANVSFANAGVYHLKASRADAIRSNSLTVCVDPPGADPCTSSDKAAPSLTPSVSSGRRLASERGRSRTVLISWQASDGAGAGVSYYSVDVREVSDGVRTSAVGDWEPLVERTALTGVHFRGDSGSAYQFRITAVDRAANRTSIVTDPLVLPVDDRDRGLWKFSKGWERVRANSAWGRTVVRAEEAGETARLRFTGRSVSLIGHKLAKGGRLKVTLDGKSRTLRVRGRSGARKVLWTSSRLRSGSHVLRLRTLGGGPVELDAVAPRP